MNICCIHKTMFTVILQLICKSYKNKQIILFILNAIISKMNKLYSGQLR